MALRFGGDGLTPGPINADELRFARVCLEPVVELAPELAAWIDVAAEVAARVVISLLTRQSPRTRKDDEERTFLGRWLPPALGIDPTGDSTTASSATSSLGPDMNHASGGESG